MSSKLAWGGLLSEFGNQMNLYSQRQAELEEKRLEEDRWNRRMQAEIAKEQAMAQYQENIKANSAVVGYDPETRLPVTKADAISGKRFVSEKELEGSRSLSPREKELYDLSKRGLEADIKSKEARAKQYEYNSGGNIDDLVEMYVANGMDEDQARELALSTASRGKRSSASSGGKNPFDDQTTEGVTKRNYPDGTSIQIKTEDELRQEAMEAALAWGEKESKGILKKDKTEEEILAKADEIFEQKKERYYKSHQEALGRVGGGLMSMERRVKENDTANPEQTASSFIQKYGVPNQNAKIDFDAAIKSMWDVESGGQDFDKNGSPITSGKGAKYKSQVMPKTADDPGFGVAPAKLTGDKDADAQEYNRVGREYLAKMLEKYEGNLPLAFAAYNAGPGAIDKWLEEKGGDPDKLPSETKAYIAKTMSQYEGYVGTNPSEDRGVVSTTEDPRIASIRQRAEAKRAAAQQQNGQQVPRQAGQQVKEMPPDLSPVPGFDFTWNAESGNNNKSFGERAGSTARGFVDAGKEAVGTVGRGLLAARDQGEKVGQLDWWKEQFAALSDWQRQSLEEYMERSGQTEDMVAMAAEKQGKTLAQFIEDFIRGYGK